MGLGAMLRARTDIAITQTLDDGSSTSETFSIVDLSPTWQRRGAYRGGMGVPAAWRAATMLSDLVGGLEWDAYRDDPLSPLAEIIRPRPSVLVKPSPPHPLIVTVSSWVLDYLWHGNAVGVKVGLGADGSAQVVIPVDARSVWIRRVMPGDAIPFPVGTIAYAISIYPGFPQLWYSSDEVMHVMGPTESPAALRGMGVLENHLQTFDLAHDQRDQAAQATGAGIPTGILTSDNPDLTSDEAADISTKWMARQASRTVAVLNATTHFQPLAWNPTEAQLVEARELGMHEIALIFGLDPSWLGKSRASMTYANVEQEAVNLLKFGSPGGLVRRFEAGLTDVMGPGITVRANLDALLRADTLSRFQAHALAFGKWLTPDEIRGIENLPPLTPEQSAQLAQLAQPPGPDPAQLHAGQGAPPGSGPPDVGTRSNPVGNAATLRRYWTKGEGLAKWADSPKPWTTLVGLLGKYVADAEGLAADYYHDVFGEWPGSHTGGGRPKGKGRK